MQTTTLQASHRDSYVLVGFFALVVLAMAVSVGLRGSPVAGLVLAALAVVIVGGGLAIGRRPPRELRVCADWIEHAVGNRSPDRVTRSVSSGTATVSRTIHRGQARHWLIVGDRRWPLDGFDGDALRSALAAHGWRVEG